MIRLFGIYHALTIIVFGIVLGFTAPQHQLGFLVGGLAIFFDLVITAWIIFQIIYKKQIALAASVIVVKYAILIAIIFFAVQKFTLSPMGFCFGIASIIPPAVLLAISIMAGKVE